MEEINNIIYFDSDDDFYNFCVVPELVPREYTLADGRVVYFSDFDFTKCYKDALSQGKRFIIKDEDSSIFKHGAVSYRTITKNVDNLDQYFDF